MIDDYKNGKIERILGIYTKLLSGNIVNKLKEAQEYGVNERTDREILKIFEVIWKQRQKGLAASIQ